MPTMEVTATTTHSLELKPTIKKRLLTALKTYVELSAQAKVLKLAKSKQASIVEEIQVELGESSLEVDGFKSTIVAGVSRTLDKKRFVQLGGRLDLLEAAMVDKPKKPYVKITAPGTSADEDE